MRMRETLNAWRGSVVRRSIPPQAQPYLGLPLDGCGLTRRVADVLSHPEAVLRADRHELHRCHALVGLQRQPAALRDRGENQPRFHHRETVADADAGTTPKRQIRVARDAFFPSTRKPSRVEAFRIVKEPGVPLKRVRVDGDEASSGDDIATDIDVLDRLARDPGRGWVQAEDLPNEHFGIRQVRKIGCRRSTAPQNVVELAEQLRLHVGVL